MSAIQKQLLGQQLSTEAQEAECARTERAPRFERARTQPWAQPWAPWQKFAVFVVLNLIGWTLVAMVVRVVF